MGLYRKQTIVTKGDRGEGESVDFVGTLHVGVGPESELPPHTPGRSRSISIAVPGPDFD